ncbi:MAG TPA: ABC transporter permease [Bryobacteraceae bacterium]|nr:ABC transporter permease [Bryobacteraceae bacterium]
MRLEHWFYIVPSRLRSLLRRSQVERELNEELRFHVDNQIDEYIARGLTPEEARYAALRAFGGVEQRKEECRDMRQVRALDELIQDVRYAIRVLWKSPGFAATAVATLALGIGANTAIFSVAHALLLKPLPYANPDELYAVEMHLPQYSDKYPSLPVRVRELIGWPQASTGVSQISAVKGGNFNLTGSGEPERIGAVAVSTNFFSLVGVQPRLGRGFIAGEQQSGHDNVLVISHEFWVRRFGADPGVLNQRISLDGLPYQVVGILPPHFLFPTGKQLHPLVPLPPRIDVWKPLALSPQELRRRDTDWQYGALVRLKTGAAAEQVRQQLEAIAQRNIQQDLPNIPLDVRVRLIPMREVFSGNIRLGLILVLCAAVLLLLIACVNIASLLLARAIHRRNEFAIRVALGAGRRRLIRQSITEGLVLSTLGGAAGLLLAVWGTRILIARAAAALPVFQEVGANASVLAFTLGVVLITGLGLSLAPAVQLFGVGMSGGLAAGAGARAVSTGTAAERLRRLLVGFEVALSAALLMTAGLLVHSFIRLMAVDKGFQVENIVCMNLTLGQEYQNSALRLSFYRDLLERIRALPAVTAAGGTSVIPLTDAPGGSSIYLESDTQLDEANLKRPTASYSVITPGYFAAVGIPLRAGRFLGEQETQPAALISEKLARALWPAESLTAVVGRRIRNGSPDASLWTVVGIVGDVRLSALDRASVPQIYGPYHQSPIGAMSIVVRTASGDVRALASALRDEVRQRDKNLPVTNLRTMSEIVAASVAQRRFQMSLVSLFAIAALALVLVGIYGLVSYSVACRTRDIGLRIALGASREEILRSVLLTGLRPVVIGLVCGIAGTVLGARALRSLLFGVGPLDPVAVGSVAVILLAAAVVACYVPARRASGLDPATALRCE